MYELPATDNESSLKTIINVIKNKKTIEDD